MSEALADVALRRLSPADATAYAAISLPPEQEVFGGRPGDAFDSLPDSMDLYGIEAEGTPVGLFRVDRGYETHDFAQKGEVGLRYFIVDRAAQGCGIAAEALAALPRMLARDDAHARSIALTVNCRNTRAYRVYERAGFRDTGALYLGGGAGPQHVMRLTL